MLGIKEIQKILPHDYPFLMVDRVLEVHEGADPKRRLGRSAVCLKNVTINEEFFCGHFPHFKVMPGVYQIEAMAQAGGIALHLSQDTNEKNIDLLIASIEGTRFRKPVIPGDQLIISAKIIKERSNFVVMECSIKVDGSVVSQAVIKAGLQPRMI